MNTTTTDYNQQALDFLKSTDATITFKYAGLKKHFSDDDEPRDCWKFTISRPGRPSYTGNFGQSLNDRDIASWNATRGIGTNGGALDAWVPYEQRNQRTTVWKQRLKIGQTSNLRKVKPPTEYDILSCVASCDPGTFEDFCADFGYSDDSIKAKATWEAVRAEYLGICQLFDHAERERLQEIC